MTRDKTYIFIDIEAALIRGRQCIIEIGAVKWLPNGTQTTFTQLIQPYKFKKLNNHIQKLTGITTEELLGAPSFREAIQKFKRWCEGHYVLFTFGEFDRKVLEEEMERHHLSSDFLFPMVDYQQKYMIAHSLREQPSLQKLMAELNLKASIQHRALADAQSLQQIFVETNGEALMEGQQTNDMLVLFAYSRQLETAFDIMVTYVNCKVQHDRIDIVKQTTHREKLPFSIQEKEQVAEDGEVYTKQLIKMKPSSKLKNTLQDISTQSVGKVILTYAGLKSISKWMRLHQCTMPKTENLKWQSLLKEEELALEKLTEVPSIKAYEETICQLLKKYEYVIIEEYRKRNLFPQEVVGI
ncbi:3'-5' exonuclease [Metasolibacillus sp. FSL H7-0170]|uniref:3'-5' exonuclease n=1 Tax=Metasolibacillus TaxID=2703677 RepID=UPI00079A534F|nr:3'-5' exonuclease [Metasolibacillus fluoroglycofenilyticus]KYG92428.1 DNA polymerase III subunit epsilon [[Bacillus] sp. KCTC 13219]